MTLEDNTGSTTLRFYHFNAAQKNNFEPGTWVRCYGEPRLGAAGLEFYHPEYDFIDPAHPEPTDTRLTPIYGLTDGISQPRLRKLAEAAVTLLSQYPPQELLPVAVNQQFATASLSQALEYVHFPPPDAQVDQLMDGIHPYQQRLAFEELLAHYLVRQKLKARAQQDTGPHHQCFTRYP